MKNKLHLFEFVNFLNELDYSDVTKQVPSFKADMYRHFSEMAVLAANIHTENQTELQANAQMHIRSLGDIMKFFLSIRMAQVGYLIRKNVDDFSKAINSSTSTGGIILYTPTYSFDKAADQQLALQYGASGMDFKGIVGKTAPNTELRPEAKINQMLPHTNMPLRHKIDLQKEY